MEHNHIMQVLLTTGWRIEGKNGAATLLGLNASTLRARMRKLGISRQ
jgi:transcriptional regulator with GAF, ATPase, and Fis domain